MYRRKLILFALTSAVFVLAAAVMVVWSTRMTSNQIVQVNMANALLAEHLQLSSTSYRLFKQLTDEILFGTDANQATVRNKRALISESLGRIRLLEAQQREALGAEFTRGTVEDTDDLEGLIDAIIGEFEAVVGLTPDDPDDDDDQVRFVLEERIDIGFREAINAAVERQSSVVDALNDRIDSIHLMMFWGSLILAALAVVLTLIGVSSLVRGLAQPVDALNDGARAIAQGNFSWRVSRGFNTEFDQIAASFNFMAEQLGRQQVSREQAQRELEYQVSQRTAELTEANAALKKSDAVRRNFLADVSHELRTPLTIIRGEAQVALRRSDRDPVEYRDALACVLEQSVSLSHLVDDLLFVARADSNSLRMNRQTVDLGSLLKDLERDLCALAEERRIELAVAAGEAIDLVADPDRIRQLLVILIENALRYSPAETKVCVRAEKDLGKEQIILTVEDQGHGIDARDLPFIFERFYRGSRSSRDNQGMGLGLTVARAIVMAHDGQIEADSQVGKGTIIRVQLPQGNRA